MIEWISNNIGTIVVVAIVIAIVVLLSISLVKDKKKGKSCCGGCRGCSMSGSCKSKQTKDKT